MLLKTTFIPGVGIIVILVVLFILGTAQRPVNRAEDEKAIKAHIDKIVRAYMARDSATVRQTHSKNWRGFLSNSQKNITRHRRLYEGSNWQRHIRHKQ